jgi:hypothetical protein
VRDLNPSPPIVDGAAAKFGPAEFLAAPEFPVRLPHRRSSKAVISKGAL